MLVSFDLGSKPVVVIGSSEEAVGRARACADEGAIVKLIVAPPAVLSGDISGVALTFRRTVRSRDLRGAFLVIAADRDKKLNSWLKKRARREGFLLNTVDEPDTSSFFNVATRTIDSSFEIAVSTGGASPAFASRMSSLLAARITETDVKVFHEFRQTRKRLIAQGISTLGFDWDQLESKVRSDAIFEAMRHERQASTGSKGGFHV